MSAGAPAHVRRMARQGGVSLVGAGYAAVTGVAMTVLVTNGFDKATAGAFFAATSLFLIACAVVQLGTDIGLVRWLPQLLVRGQTDRVRPLVRAALVPVLATSMVAAAFGLAFAEPLAGTISSDADLARTTDELRLLALALPVASAYNVLLAATRGTRTMLPSVVLESLGRSSGQLLAVGLVLLAGQDVVAAVGAWTLPYAVGLVAVSLWLRRLLRRRAVAAEGVVPDVPAGASAGSVADFWRFTGPRAVGTISQAALKRSDIVLVAALRSPREAALYAAATRFVVIGQLAVQALQQALGPQLSALFADGRSDSAGEVYRATTAWSMMLSWPIYLAVAVLAPELLRIFGDGYADVAPVVVLLSVAMLAATACGAVDTVLLMSGRAWLSLANNLSALVVNVGLNVVLIPRYGALGAGISWTVAILLRNILPLLQVARLHGISPIGRETVLVAVGSVATMGVIPVVMRASGAGAVPLVVAVGLGAAAYLVGVWRFRDKLQLSAFTAMLRPRTRVAAHD